MRAVVLVGGEGTRLRPLTYTRPKPMLPVVGRSILEHKLAHLARHGITEVVLSLGYQPKAFIDAFPDGEAAGVRLHYAVEPAPLDTAGAVRFAAAEAGFDQFDESLVVLNGDVITELDLTAQIALHRERGAEATIALSQVEDPSVFGVVPTDDDGRVLRFVEKPPRDQAPTDWINAGAYVLEQSVLRRIPAGEKVSFERVVFPAVVADRALFAVHSPAYWIDAGTPATYLQANLDALAGATHIDASASVGAATIERSVVDREAQVGDGAVVRDSVLLPGAVVRAGAVVERSVIGAGAVVGERTRVDAHSVLGDRQTVGPDAVLSAARIPGP